MEAAVDVQAVLEGAAGEQALGEHRGQEDGQGVVVAEAGDLDAHLHPAVLALALAFAVLVVAAVAHGGILVLQAQHGALRRPAHLGFHAHEGLGAVLEGDAGAAVGVGEHVVLGAHGAEVARALCDIETQRRGLAEGGAQEAKFGGREVDEGGLGRHGGRGLRCWAVGAAMAVRCWW